MTRPARIPARWTIWAGVGTTSLSVAAASVLLVFRAPDPVAEHLLRQRLIDKATMFGERVVFQLDHGRTSFRTGEITMADARRLEAIPTTSDVFSLVLFDRHGTVIWSPDPAELGTAADRETFDRLSTTREPVYLREEVPVEAVPNLQLHAHRERRFATREIAEAYVPVLDEGSMVGAVEVYVDVTDEKAFYVARVRLILAILATAGSLLVIGPLAVSARHSAARMRAMAASAEAQKAALAEQLRLAREVKLLGELNEWLQLSRSLEELFEMVGRFLERILPDSK